MDDEEQVIRSTLIDPTSSKSVGAMTHCVLLTTAISRCCFIVVTFFQTEKYKLLAKNICLAFDKLISKKDTYVLGLTT